MKTSFPMTRRLVAVSFAFCLACGAATPTNQLVSAVGPVQGLAAGGGGDSLGPIISVDGRYVLFASVANNLVPLPASPPPSVGPAPLNVFLRDRTNGTTTLLSINLDGTGGGNGDSLPIGISTNGRFALFESSASNLVQDDTNSAADVFVRDVVAGTTVLVGVSTNGGVGNGACRGSAMTPDGRYVVFISGANNLVSDDTNGIPDVFVRDLQSGITTLASVGAQRTGVASSIPAESAPGITPDGRYVVFHSTATNLVADATATNDVYLRDLTGGTTVRASAGAPAAVLSVMGTNSAVTYNYSVSADGRFVAYEASPPLSLAGLVLRYDVLSDTTDLVHTNAAVTSTTDNCSLDMTPDGRFIAFIANTNGVQGEDSCVLVWDGQGGGTTLASGDAAGTVPDGSTCDWPVLTPDGRYVAFMSSAAGLVTNSLAGDFHLYVRDLKAGTTVLVDADANGAGALLTSLPIPSVGGGGRFVAFEAPDSLLVSGDRNRSYDVFVRDLVAAETELVSVREPGLPCLSANGISQLSDGSVSWDGRYVAFVSDADNLVANDTNSCPDIFVRDLVGGGNVLVSVAADGITPGDGVSSEPSISADGRYVLFTSVADKLVAGDTNNATDVFVRDVVAGRTTLVSVNAAGTGPGNNNSYTPVLSSSGRYALFRSRATNLGAGPFIGENLFWRDLQLGTTYALTTNGVLTSTAMTPDGRYVVFLTGSGIAPSLYVWDAQTAARVYTNTTTGIPAVALSPDGRKVLYWLSTGLYAVDRVTKTTIQITTYRQPSHPGLHFSSDSRFVTYAAAPGSAGTAVTNQVYRYDLVADANLLVSRSLSGPGVPGNASSDSPDISASGRFVSYRSSASDIVSGDTNSVPDIFLYDKQTGTTVLVSRSRFGSYSAGNRSLTPFFSRDGNSLCFVSWAGDLVTGDFNFASDVFSYNLYALGAISDFQLAVCSDAQNCWLSWPVAAGKNYTVQFKDDLSDSVWQNLNGSIITIGNTAYCYEPAAAPGKRFYRVVAF